MKLLDVNVLLAAHRDDHPVFTTARPWLEQMLASGEPFTVVDLVAGSFVRLATDRRIFAEPTPVATAFEFVRILRQQPGHLHVAPGPRFWDLFEQQCLGADAAGNLVPDAQLAALAIESAAEIASFDRDFARFEAVRWVLPSAP